MTTNMHTDSPRADEREPLGQAGPPAMPPPAIPPTESGAARREAPPSATSPTPPGDGVVAWLQRMPLGGRWALGLALAFLSGFVFEAWSSGWSAINVVLMLALGLAAGFVLTNWWAALALDAAALVGVFAGIWVNVLVSPGPLQGLTGMNAVLAWFVLVAVLRVLPFLLMFLGGVGLGKTQGLSLGQPHALSAGEVTASRWIGSLAPALVAGYWTFNYSSVISVDPTNLAQGPGVWASVVSLLIAVLFSTTCLLAGWLLRSWWGAAAAVVAYAGAAAVFGIVFGAYGTSELLGGWLMQRFGLYILLPAVVMAAIGTAIGMSRGGQRGQQGQRPPYGRLAT